MTSDLSIPQPHKGGNRSKANQIARREIGGLHFFKEGKASFEKSLHCASCLGCTPKAYNSTLRSVRSVFRDVHAAAEND